MTSPAWQRFREAVKAECGPAPWLEPVFEALAREMEADGGHDAGHLWRVLKMALRLAQGRDDVDPDSLAAAALLHDLINLPKDDPNRSRASTLAAERACVVLAAHFTAHQLDVVRDAIRAHSFSAGIEPQSPEARILRDADRLEAIGAIGVARTFYVSGRMRGAIANFPDPEAEDRPLDDRAFALDHFHTKLFGLVDGMLTKEGRRIAQERVAFMRRFYDELVAELGPP